VLNVLVKQENQDHRIPHSRLQSWRTWMR